MTDDERYRLAVHESSHACCATGLGFRVDYVQVLPHGECGLDYEARQPELFDLLVLGMAGAAGESLLLGDCSQHAEDFPRAVRIAREIDPENVSRLIGAAMVTAEEILTADHACLALITESLLHVPRLSGVDMRALYYRALNSPLSAPPVRQCRR
jgi:ATP-dependent Zn protease